MANTILVRRATRDEADIIMRGEAEVRRLLPFVIGWYYGDNNDLYIETIERDDPEVKRGEKDGRGEGSHRERETQV